MKTTLVILLVSIFAIIILFFILGFFSKSGNAPGLIDGKLSQCSSKPNCVCSDIKADGQHYIEPILVSENNIQDSLVVVKQVIQDMGGVLQSENKNYAAYRFTSKIFGFVDDLEIRIDMKQNVIHIRSASRVGYSDRGVNRNRVEKVRENFKKNISQ